MVCSYKQQISINAVCKTYMLQNRGLLRLVPQDAASVFFACRKTAQEPENRTET